MRFKLKKYIMYYANIENLLQCMICQMSNFCFYYIYRYSENNIAYCHLSWIVARLL